MYISFLESQKNSNDSKVELVEHQWSSEQLESIWCVLYISNKLLLISRYKDISCKIPSEETPIFQICFGLDL